MKKYLFPITNFFCLLISYCLNKFLFSYISDSSGRRYCLCKKFHFLPPITFAYFKGFVVFNYYFYIKNKYFNSTFKLQLNKIIYNSGTVKCASKGYQKQNKVLLNRFYSVFFVSLCSLSELVYPFKH